MSATASPSLPRSHSTRRTQGYASPSHAAASPKPTAPDSPRRAAASPQVPSQGTRSRSSSAAQGNLANVAKRDAEQTNLARSPGGPRSESRDRPAREGGSSRSEAARSGASARHGHSRQVSEAASANGTGAEGSSRHAASDNAQGPRRRTAVDTKSGTWELGKTIGAGSMGKVKLARHKETHEQVCMDPIGGFANALNKSRSP